MVRVLQPAADRRATAPGPPRAGVHPRRTRPPGLPARRYGRCAGRPPSCRPIQRRGFWMSTLTTGERVLSRARSLMANGQAHGWSHAIHKAALTLEEHNADHTEPGHRTNRRTTASRRRANESVVPAGAVAHE